MPSVPAPISVLALDVDGTILTTRHTLPPAVRAAIRRVRAAGAVVILASGRGPAAMRTVVRALGAAELAICFSGGWIGEVGLEPGESRPHAPPQRLPAGLAQAAVAAAEARGIEVAWYVDETITLRAPTAYYRAELAITGETARYADLAGLPAPNKLMAACPEGQDLACLPALIADLEGRCGATFAHHNAIELWPPGVSKARGLADFCRNLGIGFDQVAAIGDSENDLEMIGEAGLGIAMGNAIPRLKAISRRVTGGNDEAGVAQAIDRLFAEGLIAPLPAPAGGPAA